MPLPYDRARLAIELDGSQHYTEDGLQYDEERSGVLEAYGLYVLRFSNNDIDRAFTKTCQLIDTVVKTRIESQDALR